MKTGFSIKSFLKKRPLSWSAISSFEWDKSQWYDTYILGKRQESREMSFGSKVGKQIEKDPTYIPEIIRHSKMEHPFKCVFNGIPLVGYADSFCNKSFKKLLEIKTGKKQWTKKRVDEHGQLDMYLLMNYVVNKIKPEDVEITLVWLPTEETKDFKIDFVKPFRVEKFSTKRTMADILKFGVRINRVVKEMELYVQEHMSNM